MNGVIGHLGERLPKAVDRLPDNTVHEIVGSVRQSFDDAPIRDFVPLFVERQTREKLAAINIGGPHT